MLIADAPGLYSSNHSPFASVTAAGSGMISLMTSAWFPAETLRRTVVGGVIERGSEAVSEHAVRSETTATRASMRGRGIIGLLLGVVRLNSSALRRQRRRQK